MGSVVAVPLADVVKAILDVDVEMATFPKVGVANEELKRLLAIPKIDAALLGVLPEIDTAFAALTLVAVVFIVVVPPVVTLLLMISVLLMVPAVLLLPELLIVPEALIFPVLLLVTPTLAFVPVLEGTFLTVTVLVPNKDVLLVVGVETLP